METPAKPVGGIDYPTTFQEFDEWFSDEDACLKYIGKLRWPNGFTCPNCGFHPESPSVIGRGLYYRVASQLDRWWLGIHQGAIRPEHLAYYLDEFTFRFNRRTSKARGLLFFRLAQLATDCKPIARQAIIGGKKQHEVGG